MKQKSQADRLRDAAFYFRCLSSSTGMFSRPGNWEGRNCPCHGCQAQLKVLAIADELEQC